MLYLTHLTTLKRTNMFSIIDKGNELVIKNPQFGIDSSLPYQVVSSPKIVLALGENSVYDNFTTKFTNKKSLSFFGNLLLSSIKDKNGDVDVEIYHLAGNNAYLISYDNGEYVTVSRSFKLSLDYAASLGFDLIKVIKEDKSTTHTFDGSLIINNDFTNKSIDPAEINSEDYMLLNLDLHNSDKEVVINLIITAREYSKDTTSMFYSEYTGFAPNIGNFKQVAVKPNLDRYPDDFPQAELDRLVVFTDLINDNAQTVLCPHIMQLEDYNGLISHAQRNELINFSYTGLHNNGCTVQVDMELLSEDENTPSYKARVVRLVLMPQMHPIMNV